MRRPGLNLAVMALLCCGAVQCARAADTELAKLGAWVGKWNSTGKIYATPYSKAMEVSSVTTCDWTANHAFVVCDQVVTMPDARTNSLAVYTYDEAAKAYKFYGVERNAPPRSVPLTIEGSLWTMGGGWQQNGKTIKVRTTNEFVNEGLVKFRTEYTADDGAHWMLMNEGTETRVH